MARPRIVDADTHVLEPPDIWKNWLPRRYLEKASRLVKDDEGVTIGCSRVPANPIPSVSSPRPASLTTSSAGPGSPTAMLVRAAATARRD